jgi:8-oxo-dGTP pyrophosphatase MutT (NUDIX family)
MNVRTDRVRISEKSVLDEYHVVESPNWALVLCFTEAGAVAMVRQYRHGIGRMSLELPAGAIDSGEEPEEAARRELLEETGLEADEWSLLGRCAPDPTRHTNYAYMFAARGARLVAEPVFDETEEMEVVYFKPTELLAEVDRGTVVHGTHLTAIYLAYRNGLLR